MAAHFTIERPKPAIAPNRPATVRVMHKEAKRPIQLKMKATRKRREKIFSFVFITPYLDNENMNIEILILLQKVWYL